MYNFILLFRFYVFISFALAFTYCLNVVFGFYCCWNRHKNDNGYNQTGGIYSNTSYRLVARRAKSKIFARFVILLFKCRQFNSIKQPNNWNCADARFRKMWRYFNRWCTVVATPKNFELMIAVTTNNNPSQRQCGDLVVFVFSPIFSLDYNIQVIWLCFYEFKSTKDSRCGVELEIKITQRKWILRGMASS